MKAIYPKSTLFLTALLILFSSVAGRHLFEAPSNDTSDATGPDQGDGPRCDEQGCIFPPTTETIPSDVEIPSIPEDARIITTAGIADYQYSDCSTSDGSSDAVFRCTNAVRVNPSLFQGDYPCGWSVVSADVGSAQRLPFMLDQSLATAAQRHSEDQAQTERMSHYGSDGSSVSDRVAAAGYSGFRVGENVAAGYRSAFQVVVDGWMCSSGHRRGILNCNFGDIGVGAARGSSSGRLYHTQVFGCKRGETCECTTGDFGPLPSQGPAPGSIPTTPSNPTTPGLPSNPTSPGFPGSPSVPSTPANPSTIPGAPQGGPDCSAHTSNYCRHFCEAAMEPPLPCTVGDAMDNMYNNNIGSQYDSPSFATGRAELTGNSGASFATAFTSGSGAFATATAWAGGGR